MISLNTTVLSARTEAVATRKEETKSAAKYFIKKQLITEGDRAFGPVSPRFNSTETDYCSITL